MERIKCDEIFEMREIGQSHKEKSAIMRLHFDKFINNQIYILYKNSFLFGVLIISFNSSIYI